MTFSEDRMCTQATTASCTKCFSLLPVFQAYVDQYLCNAIAPDARLLGFARLDSGLFLAFENTLEYTVCKDL